MAPNNLALVVGASRGLGLGLAAELRRRGWSVIATARDDAGEQRIAETAAQLGESIEVERVDVAHGEAVAELRDRLAGRTLDLLFVNAGIVGPDHKSASLATPDEIAELFLTNAIAPARIAHTFLPLVREHTGVIAVMSSIMGSVSLTTSGNSELYRASKAALNSLIRSFAAGPAGRRATVLAVHPGWVRTDMTGTAAPMDVATSVSGIADVIEARRGSLRHGFVDYQGHEIRW